jgi:uncharacterized membrane protein YhaH (DUF805 family)
MNFWQAIKSGFANYVNFSGRSIRSEYWFWVLFASLAGAVTGILDGVIFSASNPGLTPISGILGLATFLPSLALVVRRLHDLDRTGWWLLIAFTIIGAFVLIYWFCKKGTPGPNRFGPDRFASIGQISPRPAT